MRCCCVTTSGRGRGWRGHDSHGNSSRVGVVYDTLIIRRHQSLDLRCWNHNAYRRGRGGAGRMRECKAKERAQAVRAMLSGGLPAAPGRGGGVSEAIFLCCPQPPSFLTACRVLLKGGRGGAWGGGGGGLNPKSPKVCGPKIAQINISFFPTMKSGSGEGGGVRPPPPLCDIPSGCCSFTGPWTVTRSSLRMLSGRCVLSAAAAGAPAGVVSAFAGPSGWCDGAVLDVAGCAVCASAAPNNWRIEDVLVVAGVV